MPCAHSQLKVLSTRFGCIPELIWYPTIIFEFQPVINGYTGRCRASGCVRMGAYRSPFGGGCGGWAGTSTRPWWGAYGLIPRVHFVMCMSSSPDCNVLIARLSICSIQMAHSRHSQDSEQEHDDFLDRMQKCGGSDTEHHVANGMVSVRTPLSLHVDCRIRFCLCCVFLPSTAPFCLILCCTCIMACCAVICYPCIGMARGTDKQRRAWEQTQAPMLQVPWALMSCVHCLGCRAAMCDIF